MQLTVNPFARLSPELVACWLVLAWALVLLCTAPPALAKGNCGAAGDWRSALVPDQWPPPKAQGSLQNRYMRLKIVPIFKACQAHDRCYDTPGASRAACDERFHQDMRAECARVYRNLVELPQRQACYAAAYGYYQAVVKYGGEAFRAAQAASTATPGQAGVQEADRAAKQTKRPDPAVGLAWKLWGRLQGVCALAADQGKVYALKAGEQKLWVSPTRECSWTCLGIAPPGQILAAGSGRLFLAAPLKGAIWMSKARELDWRRMGDLAGVAALAVSGIRLIAWLQPSGGLMATMVGHQRWAQIGQDHDVGDLAGQVGRLIKKSAQKDELFCSRGGGIDWRRLGPAAQGGILAMDRGSVYLADPATGEINSVKIK
jgi:hypothetical protein